jgi:hypothetical protein
MSGSLDFFLNCYVYPLAGLSLLVVGGWSSWAVWRPEGGSGTGPSLAVRLSTLLLGMLWGWYLTNLEHSLDPSRVIVGFPMPVMTLSRSSGKWLELGSVPSLPCMLLNVAIGVGLANAALHQYFRRRSRRARRRERA